jgi:hypothetical protein
MGLFRKKPSSRLLDDAATVMEMRGHARGVTQDPSGRVCLMGALNVANHGDANYRAHRHGAVRGNVLRAARFTTPHTHGKKPWVFNNEAAHSGEVVDVMRRGAFDARAEEFGKARAKAMGGPFAKGRRVESSHPSVITDDMRARWSREADRLVMENEPGKDVPDFDWEEVLREERDIRDTVREKYADNPLGVATGPGR